MTDEWQAVVDRLEQLGALAPAELRPTFGKLELASRAEPKLYPLDQMQAIIAVLEETLRQAEGGRPVSETVADGEVAQTFEQQGWKPETVMNAQRIVQIVNAARHRRRQTRQSL